MVDLSIVMGQFTRGYILLPTSRCSLSTQPKDHGTDRDRYGAKALWPGRLWWSPHLYTRPRTERWNYPYIDTWYDVYILYIYVKYIQILYKNIRYIYMYYILWYIYIYIYVCVFIYIHTRTHTHISIYINICICISSHSCTSVSRGSSPWSQKKPMRKKGSDLAWFSSVCTNMKLITHSAVPGSLAIYEDIKACLRTCRHGASIFAKHSLWTGFKGKSAVWCSKPMGLRSFLFPSTNTLMVLYIQQVSEGIQQAMAIASNSLALLWRNMMASTPWSGAKSLGQLMKNWSYENRDPIFGTKKKTNMYICVSAYQSISTSSTSAYQYVSKSVNSKSVYITYIISLYNHCRHQHHRHHHHRRHINHHRRHI